MQMIIITIKDKMISKIFLHIIFSDKSLFFSNRHFKIFRQIQRGTEFRCPIYPRCPIVLLCCFVTPLYNLQMTDCSSIQQHFTNIFSIQDTNNSQITLNRDICILTCVYINFSVNSWLFPKELLQAKKRRTKVTGWLNYILKRLDKKLFEKLLIL